MGYDVVAMEVVRRLRENDARGDEPGLREMGARTIEQLLEQKAALERLVAKHKEATES